MSGIFLPIRIEFGKDSSLKVGSEFSSLKCKKVMIVSDKGVINSGLIERITKSITEAHIQAVIFDGVEPDPNIKCMETARDFYISENCDGILAVGGGSSIDTAKGAAVLVTNSEPIVSMAGVDKVNNPLPPLIAIPTTCGTGSEVTNVTVVTDNDHFKMPIVSTHLIPKVAMLDPNLLVSLPSKLISSTGLDALTHAIEALTNNTQNWYADSCALHAIRLIGIHLCQATNNRDIENLSQMLYASTLAGVAFTLSRLGLVHAMSHPVSGLAGVPHGVANAVLLPYVMSFNSIGNPGGYALVASALGIEPQENDIATALAGVKEVIKLNKQLDIPKSFRELGVNEALIPHMVEDTFKSGNIAINPRHVSKFDVEQIYKLSFSGESPIALFDSETITKN
ncbi:iron-containing alcohol dehydrogenase [Fictibacillus sp. B-59209]|uniref:iron-containing alcohol dehydrogenase family protein n=1 Tax=Fictibacillus sp. B-59209 TaxID=3024873 RepID=UPI002E23FE0B|nr:iron-containing alcohol dehydrogenase [Fictibacillus sp. B-59209]